MGTPAERLGTAYGGWWIPAAAGLGPESLVVSAGVGEDMSFDLELHAKYGCPLVLVDPTERAVRHVEEVRTFFGTGTRTLAKFTGNIQPDYLQRIGQLEPDLSKLQLEKVGLWSSEGSQRFYRQSNPSYVSQTLVAGMYGADYTEVPVEGLPHLLERLGAAGKPIDLLKLDIEGAEIEVLDAILAPPKPLLPRILCVEFDLLLKGKDTKNQTLRLMRRLLGLGYEVLQNENWNVTFVRN